MHYGPNNIVYALFNRSYNLWQDLNNICVTGNLPQDTIRGQNRVNHNEIREDGMEAYGSWKNDGRVVEPKTTKYGLKRVRREGKQEIGQRMTWVSCEKIAKNYVNL